MARKPKKAEPAPQPDASKGMDEFVVDTEGFEDDTANIEPEKITAASRSRDWRDVEKLKEERFLRRQVEDDLDLLDDVLDSKRRR